MAKRAYDFILAGLGLLLIWPLLLVLGAIIKVFDGNPVLFRQTRIGRRRQPFEILKFRTMRANAERAGPSVTQAGDPRVTPIGRWLRKRKLDELPQLWNVFTGDMSLVGPRPERPEFVDELRKQISYYDERHSVRPGLTGWAQVKYRYGSNIEDAIRKLEFDLFYLKNMSIFFDCAIILDTVRIVTRGEGGQ